MVNLSPSAHRGGPRPSQGFVLLEALIALLVVALGLLGILGLQGRTMVDTQAGVRQAQAIRLIENLSERVRLNPNAVNEAVADQYLIDWGEPQTVPSCADGCTASDLAERDIKLWKQTLVQTMGIADAKVFYVKDEASEDAGNRRQLGVMVAWRENERDQSAQTSNERESYLKYFHLSSQDASGDDVECPAKHICHLQFIALPSRCAVNRAGGPNAEDARFFCPDGGILQLKS